MASSELQAFIEDRLLALDPAMDVSAGSPAQTKLIGPVLDYLGTDPFETDIDAFLTDRFSKEFPDVYASDPGAIRDVFINPLKLILEPFKRETNSVRRGQSLIDPTMLSDDDADAVVANFFDSRDQGGYAVGVGRLYFQNPTDIRIEQAHRAFSGSYNFFPTNPMTVSAETMAFNRDGTLFYADVPLRAEKSGDEYNIDVGALAGFDGISNVVKVTNLSQFAGGSVRQDTQSLVQSAEQSLTERSLNSRRGATARISTVFKGAVKAVQVVGAKDPEMQRDLLVATGPGHAWITGSVELLDQVAYVKARTTDGPAIAVPKAGDYLYIYLKTTDYSVANQQNRTVRLRVEELLVGPTQSSGEFEKAYFVRWSDAFGNLAAVFPAEIDQTAFFASLPKSFEGGLMRNGEVRITSLPDAKNIDISVNSGEVHVYGRTDIYVRPATQDVTKTVIDGVYGLGKLGVTEQNPHFFLEQLSLTTTADSNAVSDPEIVFGNSGVEDGDTISIEEGPDAGIYTICKIDGSLAYLSQKLSSTKTGVRYRILKDVRLNPFEPRIVRFPFGDAVQADLQSTIGSNLVTFSQNDMLDFGARVGDTLRILSGLDTGDYTITAFSPTLGGQGIFLDRDLKSSSFAVPFEVFTPQEPVLRPLVRVRELLLLDSAKQSTGLTVPPADPVAITPTGPFTSAKVLGASQLASGYVIPDLPSLVTGVSYDAPSGDRRYSMGFDTADGRWVSFEFPNHTFAEFDTGKANGGGTSWFLSTTEVFSDAINTPPIEPNPGECLSIKNGPNKGDYLIKTVNKFKYASDTDGKTAYVYFVQIYGQFPVDPLRELLTFLEAHHIPTGLESLSFPMQFPGFFTSWYASLGSKLSGVMAASADELQTVVDSMSACSYEWGLPARGVLRTFFREPTLFEQKTGTADVVTAYDTTTVTGERMSFRPDPLRYLKHEVIPARVSADADPKEYPRDLIPFGNAVSFNGSGSSIFVAGVRPGDVLSVHEERFQYGDPSRQAVVSTEAGSAKLVAPAGAGAVFDASMVGDLVFLEEGDDKGGYRITSFLDSNTVTVDRILQTTTMPVLRSGSGATFGLKDVSGTNKNVVYDPSFPFVDADVDSYVSIFGADFRHMGSFKVLEVLNKNLAAHGDTVVVETATPFPAFPSGAAITRWAITQLGGNPAPSPISRASDALPTDAGQEYVGVVPVRIYESETSDYQFQSIGTDPSTSTGSVGAAVRAGINQPYRIYRPNVRRVSPTEMRGNQDGFLSFFDTEVVSLSPSSLANVPVDTYFVAREGTFWSLGYRHAVSDSNYTYSMQEEGFLDLPTYILPAGSPDSPDSMVRVVGSPLQISYEKADLVSLVQDFVNSPEDRVLSAGFLVRHFLPAYVSYDAVYAGGDEPSAVAKDIRTYLDALAIETAADVSEMEKLIDSHGGNPDTPTKISATIYDWDRRMWVEFSENQLGGSLPTDTKVPYNGSPRLVYFVPGPDVSTLKDVPSGERVKLTRR